ncbi:unnamed protein product [Durusdinium trenchii]|uniref:RNA helicase n=2 Tax=Durusdinium trenchii TaxID=1381693 RepID=A0ABP0N7N9_9DINO
MLSVPPPFSRPRYAQKAADKAHKHFASGYGDHLSLLNAYRAYVDCGSKAEFCREHFLSERNMRQAENVRKQLASLARKRPSRAPSFARLTTSIRKAFVEGFFMQCAHLDESGKHYLTVQDQQMVAIHPSSSLGVGTISAVWPLRSVVTHFRRDANDAKWCERRVECVPEQSPEQ